MAWLYERFSITITKTWEGAAVAVGLGEGAGSAAGVGDFWTAARGVWVGCTGPEDRFAHAVAASIPAMRMAAQRWELEARPERGGRVTSLRLDGEELLDQGIGVDQPTANGFVEGGAFGWDEMVPNLEPTALLPDHGEAWRLPWEVLGPGAMRCRGRLVPWELERRISLGVAVDVAYVYRNVGSAPHAAYWCAHPLLRYQPGMHIGAPVPRHLPEGTSTKVHLPRGTVDRVRVGQVEIAWDAAMTPDVGVWVCNGDLGGYRQVAVEPATASPMLEPGASLSWWLRISAL